MKHPYYLAPGHPRAASVPFIPVIYTHKGIGQDPFFDMVKVVFERYEDSFTIEQVRKRTVSS